MSSRVLDESDIHWIVNALMECGELTSSTQKLCGGLGLHPSQIIEITVIVRGTGVYSFLVAALNKWISLTEPGPMIDDLVRILRKEQFVKAAEAVLREFNSPHPKSPANDHQKRIWFEVPNRISSFIERHEELKQIHQSVLKQNEHACSGDTNNNESGNRIKEISALCGMGGIGKSTLSFHYAWQMYEEKFYHNIIWINSGSEAKIQGSFNRLLISQKLRIRKSNAECDGDGTYLTYELLQRVYECFSGTKTLFIFDNVEKSSVIGRYLPTTSSPDIQKPYILITSRNQDWGDKTDLIKLNVFSDDESFLFLKKYLSLERTDEEEYAKEISSLLQNLPLAIRQAGAYISKQCGNGKCTQGCGPQMKSYIENLKVSSKIVLDFHFWKKTEDKYKRTTFTAWNVTMKTIKIESKIAVRIMELAAYLTPDNIPIQLFTYLRRKKLWKRLVRPFEIDDAIRLLSDYSMIVWNNSEGTFNVHRLVQQVIRVQVEERRKGSSKYYRLCEIIDAIKTPLKMMNYDEFETQCLVQCSVLKEYIQSNAIQDSFSTFLKLLERKQEDSIEDHIDKFAHDIRLENYANAFELLNAFIRKTHLDKFGLQLEHVSPYYVQRFSKIICSEIDIISDTKPDNYKISPELSQQFKKLLKSIIRTGLSDKDFHRGTLEALRYVPGCALKVATRTEDMKVKSELFKRIFTAYNLFYNYYEEHRMCNRITEIVHGIIHCLTELSDAFEILRFIDKFKQNLEKMEIITQKYPFSKWMNLTETIFEFAKHPNCIGIRRELLQEAHFIYTKIHKASKRNIPAYTVALVLQN